MRSTSLDWAERPTETPACWRAEGAVELPLLLPGWQAAELERLAHLRGLTVGQLVRGLIRDQLSRLRPDRASRAAGGTHAGMIS